MKIKVKVAEEVIIDVPDYENKEDESVADYLDDHLNDGEIVERAWESWAPVTDV